MNNIFKYASVCKDEILLSDKIPSFSPLDTMIVDITKLTKTFIEGSARQYGFDYSSNIDIEELDDSEKEIKLVKKYIFFGNQQPILKKKKGVWKLFKERKRVKIYLKNYRVMEYKAK